MPSTTPSQIETELLSDAKVLKFIYDFGAEGFWFTSTESIANSFTDKKLNALLQITGFEDLSTRFTENSEIKATITTEEGKAGVSRKTELKNLKGNLLIGNTNVLPYKTKSGIKGHLCAFTLDHERSSKDRSIWFESIIKATDLGVWLWNVESGETIFNEKWASIIGYQLSEIEPVSIDTWLKFVHPEDQKTSAAALEELFARKTLTYDVEVRMKHKDGDWVWVQARGRVMTWLGNGKPEWMAGSHLDITDSKKSKNRLDTALETINAFITNAPSAIAMLNKKLEYIAVSDQWIKSYKIDDPNIIGTSHYEVFPEIGENWKKDHQEALSGKTLSNPLEEFVRADGSSQWLYWDLRPWYDQHGEIGGIIMHTADRTSEKQNEILALKYQDLLERTNEIARIGTWELDLKKNELIWSEMTREIHEVPEGYTPTLAEGINFYTESAKPIIAKAVEEGTTKGLSFDKELTILTAKGNERWVRAIGIPVMVDGVCVKLYGIFQDIDEKTKSTNALALREEQFRLAFNLSPVAMALVGLEGQWIRVNEKTCEMFGYSDHELLRLTFQELTHQDDLQKDLNLLEDLVAGKIQSYAMEKRYYHKSGDIIWAKLYVSMVKDNLGNPLHFVSQIENITNQKKNQLRLERTIQRLQGILDASTQVAIIETDVYGTIKLFNVGAENILGYYAQETKNLMSLQEFFDKKELNQYIKDQNLEFSNPSSDESPLFEIVKEEGALTHEWKLRKKNKTKLNAMVSITTISGTGNNKRGYLAIITDIDALKMAEQENQKLLSVTQDQNDRLLNFAHIVSHNLRSHTGNFQMLLALAKREGSNVSVQEIFPMIEKASHNLKETVDHLNEVIISENATSDMLSPLDLKEYVESALNSIEGLLSEIPSKINVDIEEGLRITGLPAYLESCIHNFLTNAIRYRSPDRDLEVNISSETSLRKVKLHIEDNGLGIDLERHGDRLFGMYKTFHKHKNARGIGLFITKSQVEAMGGSIDVKSTVNVGTTFTLTFNKWKSND